MIEKPAACSASLRTSGCPRPAVGGRFCAGGSVSTRSIVTEPMWKKRRIAVRACGTAIATAIAAIAVANARTRARRVRVRRSSRARTTGARFGAAGTSSSRPSATSARSSSVIRFPQPFERTGRTRLDCSPRKLERSRGLLFGELREVAERNDLPLILRQVVHCGEQRVTPFRVEQRRLGGRGRAPRGLLCGRAHGELRAATSGTATVARLVGDDLQHPGTERRACAKPPQRAPRLDEAVLCRVLGFGRTTGDEVRGAECDALVCVHELCVGVVVAAPRAFDQFGFVEWTALHYAGHTPAATLEFQWRVRSGSTTWHWNSSRSEEHTSEL